VSDASKSISGCPDEDGYNLTNGILTLNANASNDTEIYYRFMVPDASKMYIFEKGKSYTLSGKVKLSTTEGTFGDGGKKLTIRSQSYQSDWTGGINENILETETNSWTPFEKTFTIEENSTGYYVSF
jgi:hypothetical protein